MSDVTSKASPTATVPAVPPATSTTQQSKKRAPGLTFRRFFTKIGVNPYDEVEWEKRTAQITDSQGGIIFEQKDVEVPKDWSMTATNMDR
jgi:ribonucleoside-diphosphate reductase alpha chain